MKTWWEGLNPRERLLVAVGLLAVTATLIFLLVLEPMQVRQARAQAQLATESAALARVRELAAEAGRLQGQAATTARGVLPSGQSLLAVLNDSAVSGGIQGHIERVVPNGAQEASMTFDGIAFDALMAWLVGLRAQFGVEARQLVIDKTDVPGQVNASLTLATGG